ncbi:MAG: AAA family ATPase, partial [Pirellula sp.]
ELTLLIVLFACKHTESISLTARPSDVAAEVSGLVGDHVRIQNGVLPIHIHEFQDRLKKCHETGAPRWHDLHQAKQKKLELASTRLKVHDLKARVLTSFVRNQLIDEVYLPRIGDNLAKQIGTADENKRTDRMGLLLLISPPGYGKTTLMEYVASRLGLVLVKVNGPALGHDVTSLDPSAAPNAAARDEVLRINLALEMRDNTLLYIDDIQHCNVELLQKFIPLCDATRRIEGVWEGKSKTYDFRGRKFAVVMAGNPYTESGQRFQIPDMLANRADVYNLGEIIGGNAKAFEQSYLENCLTSNTSLLPLARASNKDQRRLIAAAESDNLEPMELESNLSPDSIGEMHQVLRKLHRVRDIVLKVNREYIRSAAQSDDYRTEPPFNLQGSYRNMNRIAEKVVSVMNDSELMQTIVSSFEQDAQTLSKDGESNILKFKELLGTLTAEEEERWQAIKRTFVEKNRLKGLSDQESSAQFLVSILSLKDGLDAIHNVLDSMGKIHRENLESNRFKEQTIAPEPNGNSIERPTNDSIPESKIIVQHAVPRVIADLIRGQYQLLFDGLKPVIESLTQQSVSNDRLRSSMKEVLELYDKLMQAAEKTKKKSDLE